MSEQTVGRSTGGGRSSTVRRGFELYAPASRAAAAKRAEATKAAAAAAAAGSGADGHDTTRGRALWEENDGSTRVPSGDKEWKRDRWDEEDVVNRARSGRRGEAAPASATSSRRDGVRSRAAAAVASVDPDVPSGEQYEDISRKVEEEVVAKLARAQMMGMMLKAHRQEEQAAERRRGGGSANGGRRSRGGGGDSAGPRQVLQRPSHTDKASSGASGGGSGGRQRQGQASASLSGSVDARGAVVVGRDVRITPPPRGRDTGRSPRGGGKPAGPQGQRGGVAAASSPRPAGLLRVSPDELSTGASAPARSKGGDVLPEDLGADPDAMSIDETYAVVGLIEPQQKALLEDLRMEAGLIATGRSGGVKSASGPSAVIAATTVAASASRDGLQLPGAALYGKLSRIRGALSRALGSLVRRNPSFSLRKRLPHRLWMAHYRELDIIQQRLRQLAGDVGGARAGPVSTAPSQQQQQQQKARAKQRQALRARLFVLIGEAERDIGAMVSVVEQQTKKADALKYLPTPLLSIRKGIDTDRGSDGGQRPVPLPSTGINGGTTLDVNASEDMASGDVDSVAGGQAGSDSDSDDAEEELTLEERGRQQALQAFLTSLGDLARYRGLHGGESRGGGSSAGGGKGGGWWQRAQELYHRALRVDPSSGKVRICLMCASADVKIF